MDFSTALLLRMHSGDAPAAAELWSLLGPRLVALAAQLLRSAGLHDHAHDLVQNVFVSLLRCPSAQLARVEDAHAFLSQSVRNAALNLIRSRQREKSRLNHAVESARLRMARGGAGAAPQRLTPDQSTLLDAIQSLSEDARDLLLLKHVAGLTFDQLALCLNENRSTLASRHAQALAALRRRLEDELPSAAPTLTASGGAS